MAHETYSRMQVIAAARKAVDDAEQGHGSMYFGPGTVVYLQVRALIAKFTDVYPLQLPSPPTGGPRGHAYTCQTCQQAKTCRIAGCRGDCATLCTPCIRKGAGL